MQFAGRERGLDLLGALSRHAQNLGLTAAAQSYSAYRNTISVADQARHPGDVQLEERITALVRWNALAMVVRVNRAYGELGGHIASYASAAEIFEIGFNHFFRGPDARGGADLVFFQPHSAPGVYARAFLEGRLQAEHLGHYRQEVSGKGLCSYPHPWLMPEFWQFTTGSMGIGPISAIYHASFMRYLANRGLADTEQRHVWGVFGDGEMDEPESIAGLTLAAREKLDNVTFIINCNLQRLDGPVRGNGQIIQELESLFVGAGWNVIKVLWGSNWDALFALDRENALLRRFAATSDGEYQTLGAKDGEYNLSHFFDSDPELKRIVAHLSPDDVDALKRGGHDLRKLYAAFAAANAHRGRPTVILAKTKKGFGMGPSSESRMTSHQQKKLELEDLRYVRDRFNLPLNHEQVANLEFYRPAPDSPEVSYLMSRRAALGGFLPARQRGTQHVQVPHLDTYAQFALQPGGKAMSTTMAAVRLFSSLLKDKSLGPRIVPIVADEARTFGMASLFRQIGIYAPEGQLYQPEDSESLLVYREKRDGQPNQRARGFLLGATAGRTTLGGEGLQHQDGTSHVIAATVPNCRAYDPAFAGELAVILDNGAREMLERGSDVFYYVTVMNENYAQPDLPADSHEAVIKGMYRFASHSPADTQGRVHLLGSGAIFREVIAAAELLATDWRVASDVWSVTSFSELARDARETARFIRLHPDQASHMSHLATCLADPLPVIAATDYVAAYPGLISSFIRQPFVSLGTDGFGRSDTRDALRRFFEVDRHQIVVAALYTLADEGSIPPRTVSEAIARYRINPDASAPWKS